MCSPALPPDSEGAPPSCRGCKPDCSLHRWRRTDVCAEYEATLSSPCAAGEFSPAAPPRAPVDATKSRCVTKDRSVPFKTRRRRTAACLCLRKTHRVFYLEIKKVVLTYDHTKCLRHPLFRFILCEAGSREMREHTKVVGCRVKATRDK